MICAQIAQWVDAIGSLGAALVALFVVLYFEIFVASKRRLEERTSLINTADDEALLNKVFAERNTEIEKLTSPVGFIHQESSCVRAFRSSPFNLDDYRRTIIGEYIEAIEHVNSLIRAFELERIRPDGKLREALHDEMKKNILELQERIQEFREVLDAMSKEELKGWRLWLCRFAA